MANRIYSVEEIELQGWEAPIKIHPLTIKKLREVFDALNMEKKENQELPFVDILLNAVAITMKTFCPPLSDKDLLEEHVDQLTLEHILEIAAGIKLNDPKLEAAVRANGMNI